MSLHDKMRSAVEVCWDEQQVIQAQLLLERHDDASPLHPKLKGVWHQLVREATGQWVKLGTGTDMYFADPKDITQVYLRYPDYNDPRCDGSRVVVKPWALFGKEASGPFIVLVWLQGETPQLYAASSLKRMATLLPAETRDTLECML